MLEIKAFDHDMLFGDELIGTTTMDLEDRYFLPEWNAIKHKPVEYRALHHPSSAVSQGVIKMWVEIIDAKLAPEEMPTLYDIRQKPPEDFEVRLCIFGTKEIKLDSEGVSDVFFRCFFDSKKDALETDTHFRNQDGKASFNYRLLYKITHPRKDYKFTI